MGRGLLRGVGLALAGVLLAGCGSAVEGVVIHNPDDPDGLTAKVLPRPYQASEAGLRDTAGDAVSLRSLATRPLTLVFFGYTNCDDVCPTTLGNIAAALARLSAEQRAQVGVVFVTSDPARDDAATLKEYLRGYDRDGSFVGLTGDIDQIIAAGKPFGVYVAEGEALPSGGYDVTHGDTVTGMLPDGTAPLVWMGGFSSKQLSADLTEVLENGIPDVKQ